MSVFSASARKASEFSELPLWPHPGQHPDPERCGEGRTVTASPELALELSTCPPKLVRRLGDYQKSRAGELEIQQTKRNLSRQGWKPGSRWISAYPQQTHVVYLPLSQRLYRPWITSYRLLCTALSPSLHPQVYRGLHSPAHPGRRAVTKLEWKIVGSFLVADFVWFSVSLNKWNAMSRTRINQSFETKNRSICFKNLVSYILTTLSKSNGTNIKN